MQGHWYGLIILRSFCELWTQDSDDFVAPFYRTAHTKFRAHQHSDEIQRHFYLRVYSQTQQSFYFRMAYEILGWTNQQVNKEQNLKCIHVHITRSTFICILPLCMAASVLSGIIHVKLVWPIHHTKRFDCVVFHSHRNLNRIARELFAIADRSLISCIYSYHINS